MKRIALLSMLVLCNIIMADAQNSIDTLRYLEYLKSVHNEFQLMFSTYEDDFSTELESIKDFGKLYKEKYNNFTFVSDFKNVQGASEIIRNLDNLQIFFKKYQSQWRWPEVESLCITLMAQLNNLPSIIRDIESKTQITESFLNLYQSLRAQEIKTRELIRSSLKLSNNNHLGFTIHQKNSIGLIYTRSTINVNANWLKPFVFSAGAYVQDRRDTTALVTGRAQVGYQIFKNAHVLVGGDFLFQRQPTDTTMRQQRAFWSYAVAIERHGWIIQCSYSRPAGVGIGVQTSLDNFAWWCRKEE